MDEPSSFPENEFSSMSISDNRFRRFFASPSLTSVIHWYKFTVPLLGYRCPLVTFEEAGGIDDVKPACELPSCVAVLVCHLVITPATENSAGILLDGVIGFHVDKQRLPVHVIDKIFGRGSYSEMQWSRIESVESRVMNEIHFVWEDPWEMRLAGTSVFLQVQAPLMTEP